MPTFRERLRNPLAASAGLTRAARVNLDKLAPGTFSLVREFFQEVSPSSIVDGLRQHSACKSLDVQFLDNNHAVVVDQYSRDFVLEVGPLVLNVRVLSLQHGNSFSAPVRPLALAPCHPPLRHAQFALCIAIQTWIVNLSAIAIAQGREGRQANVDSDCRGRRRQRGFVALHGEDGKPTSGLTPDRDSLDLALDGTVELDLDLPHSLNADHFSIEFAAITIRWKGQTVVSGSGLEAREPRLLPTLNATEECFECLVEASQNVLTAGEVGDSDQPFGPHLLQLPRLIVVVDRLPADPICPNALFKSAVVEITGFQKLVGEGLCLCLVGVYPVFERLTHSNHL